MLFLRFYFVLSFFLLTFAIMEKCSNFTMKMLSRKHSVEFAMQKHGFYVLIALILEQIH